MSTPQKPSAGAMRAAHAVMDKCNMPVFSHVAEQLAAIIDRETGLREMAEALSDVLPMTPKQPGVAGYATDRNARAALARHHGKEQL